MTGFQYPMQAKMFALHGNLVKLTFVFNLIELI